MEITIFTGITRLKRMKQDIKTEEDTKLLVDRFYAKVNEDPLLSRVFNEVAKVDWETHLPKMYQFWSSQLLGTRSYNGRPFPPHMELHLTAAHFAVWLKLFTATVIENFQGPTADMAVYKANNIALVFQHKLGII